VFLLKKQPEYREAYEDATAAGKLEGYARRVRKVVTRV
jgi:hypothetical protein